MYFTILWLCVDIASYRREKRGMQMHHILVVNSYRAGSDLNIELLVPGISAKHTGLV